MTPFQLILVVLVAGTSLSFSQTCQTVSALPAEAQMLARGKVILDNDGVVSIKGGQAVYARVTNQSSLSVSYLVALEVFNQETKTYDANCTYKAMLEPGKSGVVWGSSAKEAPVPWRVSVTMGPETDDEARVPGLSFGVYSNPPKVTKSLPRN